ncbi:MAG: hypothetical protein P8Y44_00385, partial [Acidobacteriota bacterium]
MIQQNSSDRVLGILASNVVLSGLTITGGEPSAMDSSGGGIYHLMGALEIRDCTIEDNHLDQGHGAGIFSNGPSVSLTLIDSEVLLNTTSGTGGGIRASGPVVIVNSLIAGNRRPDDNPVPVFREQGSCVQARTPIQEDGTTNTRRIATHLICPKGAARDFHNTVAPDGSTLVPGDVAFEVRIDH